MENDRHAAVVGELLNRAGLKAGDLMRLAESLPPETIAQFDKLLNHKEPSVGPGMDSGIVVAYKSGEVVRDRPMQGNFSKEGIAVYEAGGYVPSPKEKPRSPVGQELYGLGDIEYRAELEPYLSEVLEIRSSPEDRGKQPLEDDYVALLGLRALEQKHGGDYGEFIDADARRLDPRWSANLALLAGYKPGTDQIRVKTTPTPRQSMDARMDEVEHFYDAYFSRPNALTSTAHELFHAGMQRINPSSSESSHHSVTDVTDWERLRKTPEGRAVVSVLQKSSFGDNSALQPEKPYGFYDMRYVQAEARDRYEQMGPPRVKNYEDGGAVEPRSADPEAEILAIYDLLDEENRKPERKRDPERIEELYSRLTELQAMLPPPVALELSDDVYLRPQFDARFGIGESNRREPFFEDTVQIRDRNMGGIGRLGAEIGFPGFSGNDRLSGGVTATYNRTKRLLPDEYVALGAPSDIRFGPRGVVPRGYDVSYSSGPHTMSGRYGPRTEGAPRNMPGGRSVQTFGYSYQTPQETFSVEATPFGRNMVDPQTGEPLGMDRRIYARYSTSF